MSEYLPGQTLLFSLFLRLFLGLMILFFDTLMFPRKFFLLILSYFATKDVLLVHSECDNSFSQYYFLSHLHLVSFLLPKIFVNIGFATSPRSCAAADAKSPIGNPFPLRFLYLFSPPMYQTPARTNFFSSHSNKLFSV